MHTNTTKYTSFLKEKKQFFLYFSQPFFPAPVRGKTAPVPKKNGSRPKKIQTGANSVSGKDSPRGKSCRKLPARNFPGGKAAGNCRQEISPGGKLPEIVGKKFPRGESCRRLSARFFPRGKSCRKLPADIIKLPFQGAYRIIPFYTQGVALGWDIQEPRALPWAGLYRAFSPEKLPDFLCR
jgi:hypothetical protein